MRVKSMKNMLFYLKILIAVSVGAFILTGLYRLNAGINSIAQSVFFYCLLFAASVWDIRKRIIPDVLCAAILLTGMMSFTPNKVFGVLLGLPLLIAALIKEGGIGGGDIKLTAASGFVLGLSDGVAGLIFALTIVLFYYLGLKIICKIRREKPFALKETALPLAPFLSVGFTLATLFK